MADNDQSRAFRFLDLPGELRNKIYDYCTEANPIVIRDPVRFARGPGLPDPTINAPNHFQALTQVNQQIRKEYLSKYNRLTEFVLPFRDLAAYREAFQLSLDKAPEHWQLALDLTNAESTDKYDGLDLMRLCDKHDDLKITFVAQSTENDVNFQFEVMPSIILRCAQSPNTALRWMNRLFRNSSLILHDPVLMESLQEVVIGDWSMPLQIGYRDSEGLKERRERFELWWSIMDGNPIG